MKKPAKYQYTFMDRKLRAAVAVLEERIRNSDPPPPEILEKYLHFLQEIDRIESEPTVREIDEMRKGLAALTSRVAVLEASRGGAKAFGR